MNAALPDKDLPLKEDIRLLGRLLGDTVRYSFVRDPDGNFIELSQRASLVGHL